MIAAGITFSARVLRLLRRVSIAYFHDLLVSLCFIYNHLIPRTIHLFSSSADLTSVHIWTPLLHRRSKPSVVLIHGFGGDAKWQWRTQIGALSRSFNLYIPDLIFFGNSRSDSPNRSVQFQAECIAQAMKQLGVKRYNVVGISYGGFVAYRMGSDVATEEVEKIVLLTSGVGVSEERIRELVQREGRDVRDILCPKNPEDLRLLVRRSMYRPPIWMPDFYLREFIKVKYMDHRKERIELLEELLKNGAGVSPLPVLSQETLLLWGDQDQVFPVDFAHELHRHLGKQSSLEIIKDAGHALQLEQPRQVNRHIQHFLLPPARSK